MEEYFFMLTHHYNTYPGKYTASICALILLSAVVLLSSKGEKAASVPTLSISAGIFFTFLGLALSFQSVSGTSVDKQYSTLLSGLGTAFWTSVTGMGVSIFARFLLVFRKTATPLTELQQELSFVRQQIKGVGEEVGHELSDSMKRLMNSYSEVVNQQLEVSSVHIEKMNARFVAGTDLVEQSYSRLNTELQTMMQEITTIVATTHQFTENVNELLSGSQNIYQQQAQWVSDIQASMESIAVMAPEAKTVFHAIEAFNQDYQSGISNLEARVKKNQEIFVTDIDEHTVKVIQRIAAFDDEYRNKVTEYLERMDESVNKSFETIINYFGGGMASLAEKQLMVVAETVEQIHQAKKQMVDVLSAKDDASITDSPKHEPLQA